MATLWGTTLVQAALLQLLHLDVAVDKDIFTASTELKFGLQSVPPSLELLAEFQQIWTTKKQRNHGQR